MKHYMKIKHFCDMTGFQRQFVRNSPYIALDEQLKVEVIETSERLKSAYIKNQSPDKRAIFLERVSRLNEKVKEIKAGNKLIPEFYINTFGIMNRFNITNAEWNKLKEKPGAPKPYSNPLVGNNVRLYSIAEVDKFAEEEGLHSFSFHHVREFIQGKYKLNVDKPTTYKQPQA